MTKPNNRVTASHILQDEGFRDTAALFHALNSNWKPHKGQIEVGESVMLGGARRVFVECGRKWGKSEWAVDMVWRLGNMIQGGQIYYYGAYAKAVREFIWASQRLQSHGPQEYIQDIHKTEMRVTFTSGTFVKCDGADEFKVSKGFNPDVVILDEFADYPEDFWVAMGPNFASKDCIVIIITSPPWILESEPGVPALCCRIADLWAKYEREAKAKGKNSKYKYINQPTHMNDRLPAGFLEQEEKDLRELGMEDVWEREYMARRVVSGGKRIIPTFIKAQHVRPHQELMDKIERDRSILQWVDIADPSQSAFGVALMAINPYSKEVFWLGEILEKEDSETMEQTLWPRMKALEDELFPPELSDDTDRFLRVSDEAAQWWIVGCANDPEIGVHFMPTEKHLNSKEFGLSLIRSIFKTNRGYVSDNCPWTAWQFENYRRDKNGMIPKRDDDLIDCSRYGLHAVGYFLSPEDLKKPVKVHPREFQRKQHISMDEDMREFASDLEQNHHYFSDNLGDESWH